MRRIRLAIGIVLLLALLGGLAWGLGGRGVHNALRSQARAFVAMFKGVLDRSPASASGGFANVIFLHHSTGRSLIEQGGVREAFAAAGYGFWDHDYNARGLTRPDGTSAGYSYNIPNDNTDPDGFDRIFSQRLCPWPLNAFSGLMQHEVIIFKSCFPVGNITADAQLEQYKAYHLRMRDVMDQHPDHVFIVVTPPPLNPAATEAGAAARARAFAEWLKSDDFLAGHPNIFTFDFFDLLAESGVASHEYNMLRAEYREGVDSHPNELANRTIGPRFVEFVMGAVQDYRASLDLAGDD